MFIVEIYIIHKINSSTPSQWNLKLTLLLRILRLTLWFTSPKVQHLKQGMLKLLNLTNAITSETPFFPSETAFTIKNIDMLLYKISLYRPFRNLIHHKSDKILSKQNVDTTWQSNGCNF